MQIEFQVVMKLALRAVIVFTLDGVATISWKSVKQTCITRSIMEYKFIALELAGQEVDWLSNLLTYVSFWGKWTPVSFHCDS
ncbi:hypothetical protein LIER_28334 [Lithospermum erythrorhizon]|uniref:Secreted protein n=1 Tax=Lithospermum erythrorhizon TaxID=34254 RepID=A0AAV3RJ79_LITER